MQTQTWPTNGGQRVGLSGGVDVLVSFLERGGVSACATPTMRPFLRIEARMQSRLYAALLFAY